jgi:hypothetical protein
VDDDNDGVGQEFSLAHFEEEMIQMSANHLHAQGSSSARSNHARLAHAAAATVTISSSSQLHQPIHSTSSPAPNITFLWNGPVLAGPEGGPVAAAAASSTPGCNADAMAMALERPTPRRVGDIPDFKQRQGFGSDNIAGGDQGNYSFGLQGLYREEMGRSAASRNMITAVAAGPYVKADGSHLQLLHNAKQGFLESRRGSTSDLDLNFGWERYISSS